jgi:hypothetical protein
MKNTIIYRHNTAILKINNKGHNITVPSPGFQTTQITPQSKLANCNVNI